MDRLAHLDPLSAAEQRLLNECREPDRVTLGDGERPIKANEDCEVRADFLRVLLTADDTPLHDKGLRLRGAWVSGALDLQGVTCPHDLTFRACHFTQPINLLNASLQGLHFSDVWLPGLIADNTRFAGSLYLRGNSRVEGELTLAGGRIDGSLQLCGAEIISASQDAVFAPSLMVGGSVFLGNYPFAEGTSTLVCEGTLFFASAQIDKDFFVTNTAISLRSDRVSLGVFDAVEEHGHDIALSLGRARIGGLLFLKDTQIGQGVVNLAGAFAERFKDDPSGPGANYPIRLDGFRYNDFSRHTDTDLSARLNWLERRPDDTPFTAQPYEQLARVMTTLGHDEDARTILIRKEQLLRRENRQIIVHRWGHGLRWALFGLRDWVLNVTVAYGYRPGRSILWAFALIAGLGWMFNQTWKAGDMTPNAAPILVSPDWISATQSHPNNPAAFWSQPGQAGQDWETFSGYAYAADLVIPLISLGQESAWAPSTSRSHWGRIGWWVRWFAKGIGWVIAALVAAAVTGLIRQK